jgi:hypothetical protein
MQGSATRTQLRHPELATGVFVHPGGGLWLPALGVLIAASIPEEEDLEQGPRPELIVVTGDPGEVKISRINRISGIIPVTDEPGAWRRTGLPVWTEWLGGGLRVLPRLPDSFGDGVRVVPGEYHPVVSVGDAASTGQRLPVYLVYSKAILIPAPAGVGTSFDIGRGLPPALAPLADSGPAEAFALRRGEVLPMGKLRLKARQVRAESA